MPRESVFSRLIRHFHEHPQGRLHEILFWAGLGVVTGAVALFGWMAGKVATPFALMLGVIAVCFVLWSLLPQRRKPPAPPAPGKRGELQQLRAKEKGKGRRKGPSPPSR